MVFIKSLTLHIFSWQRRQWNKPAAATTQLHWCTLSERHSASYSCKLYIAFHWWRISMIFTLEGANNLLRRSKWTEDGPSGLATVALLQRLWRNVSFLSKLRGKCTATPGDRHPLQKEHHQLIEKPTRTLEVAVEATQWNLITQHPFLSSNIGLALGPSFSISRFLGFTLRRRRKHS